MKSRALLISLVLAGTAGSIAATATSAQAATGCRVDYAVTSSWPGGSDSLPDSRSTGTWRERLTYGVGQLTHVPTTATDDPERPAHEPREASQDANEILGPAAC